MSIEGRHLGEFETLERLGQGGMGAVYKARQKSLRRTVALKTLQASLAEDQEYIARFQQEAVAAAALNHPNLVQVYSAGEDEGLHWFAMEYVEGESAQTRLKREGRLDPSDAVAIVIHVATALEYGWRKAALIHRDIKPDNIFLSEDGEVKLGDLGLAKSVGQTQGLTVTGTMMGTPNYISPEQAQGMGDVDLRADIYSLGCTLYHLLSGQPPYAGTSAVAILMKHVSAPVPDLSSVWPECPPELAALVMKMMRKVPAERPQNYAEVIAELRRIYDLLTAAAIGSEVAASTPQSMVEREPASPEIAAAAAPQMAAPRKSRLPLYVGLATGAVALAGGASLLFRPKEKQHTNLTPFEAQTVIPQSETKISAATAKRIAEPVPPTSPAPARAVESWENMLGEGTIREMKGAVEQTPQGLLISGAGEVLTPFRRRDGAVRLRAIFGGMRPVLRARDGHEGRYELHAGGDGKSIIARTITPGAAIPPQTYTLSRPMVAGEYYEIELRTVGRMVTVKHNGNVLGSIVDDTLSEGRFGFASTLGTADGQPTVVATLELLDLTPPPAEPWQNVLGDPANLELSGGAERIGEGLRFTEYGSAILRKNHGPQRDGAVRMRTTFGDAYPQLRARNTGTAAYTLHAQTDNFIVLGCYVYLSKQFTTLRAPGRASCFSTVRNMSLNSVSWAMSSPPS